MKNVRKKILFGVLYLLLLYGVCECVSFLFYLAKEQQFFSFSEHQTYRLKVNQQTPAAPDGIFAVPSINAEVIHPYLGFVINPREAEGHSEYGFLGEETPFHLKTDNNVIVGIFGGSFAGGIAEHAQDEIVAQLQNVPAFAGKEIIVHTLALGGYKQPQQLLALTYFLSLGAHFDIVINLDGFNEVTLAPAENAGVIFPFYPRGWPARVGNFVDSFTLRTIAEMVSLDERMQRRAKLVTTSPLRYSITANLIWRYSHLQLYNRRMAASQQLEEHTRQRQHEFGYIATGPSFHYANDTEMFQALADVWKTCSLQMHSLCAANNIAYFHFLQPNQYVPGSKPMSRRERDIAFREDHLYRPGVVAGYPLLIEEGQSLQARGVHFRDLTMIFADNDEALYSDDCCHLTPEGYSMIGERIGETIADYYSEP